MAESPFERYGGFVVVRKIVSDFYDKVLESEQLQKHFENTEMRLLIDHQTKFIASVMGGPTAYSDDALRRVHRGLGITHDEFMESAMLLRETLEDYDLDEADINQVYEEFTRRESSIVMAK